MSQHPMSQHTAPPPATARHPALPSLTGVRGPAVVCATGSAGHLVVALVAVAVPSLGLGLGDDPMLWFGILLAVLHVQQLAGVLALSRSGYAGPGAAARVGFGSAALGGVLFMSGELVYQLDAGASDVVFGLASVTSALGMILAGIMVLRAGRWAGPGRFLPLAIGVYLVAVLTPLLAATPFGLLGIAGWAALWLLLGLALFSGTAKT